MSLSEELYREILLEHFKNPRNKGLLDPADISAHGTNPLCGDEINLTLRVKDGRIVEVGFEGHGCSISQASASIMTEIIKGKTPQEALALVQLFKEFMRGERTLEGEEYGDLEALQGVRKYPVRIKCALLAWTTLEEGINESSR